MQAESPHNSLQENPQLVEINGYDKIIQNDGLPFPVEFVFKPGYYLVS
jgi:hypothetical protein